MPTPATPLLLVDNHLDTVMLYPTSVLSTSSEQTGHEAYRVASYRRERQSWQTLTTAADHWIAVAHTAAHPLDYLFLDRGHNLAGLDVELQSSDDGVTWATAVSYTIPAAGTLGGDPTGASGAVTEEGAWYALFAATAAHRYWRFLITSVTAPVVTGILFGSRTQLAGYSGTYDEDAGGRTDTSLVSTAGYKGSDAVYAWRTIELDLSVIGAAEYDATMRALRELLFRRNQPWICAMDYVTHPERAWMYQYDGTSWAMAKKRVYRAGRILGREVGASLV